MFSIFTAQANGKYGESLKKAKKALKEVEGMSEDVSSVSGCVRVEGAKEITSTHHPNTPHYFNKDKLSKFCWKSCQIWRFVTLPFFGIWQRFACTLSDIVSWKNNRSWPVREHLVKTVSQATKVVGNDLVLNIFREAQVDVGAQELCCPGTFGSTRWKFGP